MLNKNQSKKWNYWKYVLVLPLLGAFLFLFQVKVVAQEKATPKQENETKSDSADLTKFKVEKDLTTLSKGKEVYINGEKSSQEELDKLDPKEIERIDVIKKNSNPTLIVTTKNLSNHLSKTIKITDKDIYINDVKSTNEDFNKIDQKTIDKVDINTVENTVKITTKTEKPIASYHKDYYIDGVKSTYNVYRNLDLNTIEVEANPFERQVRVTTIKAGTRISTIDSEEDGDKNGKNGAIITLDDGSWDYDKALVILDGKESDYKTVLKNADKELKFVYATPFKNTPDENKRIVLAKYGEKARNGVLVVETNSYRKK